MLVNMPRGLGLNHMINGFHVFNNIEIYAS